MEFEVNRIFSHYKNDEGANFEHIEVGAKKIYYEHCNPLYYIEGAFDDWLEKHEEQDMKKYKMTMKLVIEEVE